MPENPGADKSCRSTFIVNDRVDLAMLVGRRWFASGPGRPAPEAVREMVGEKMIIGLSTHSPAQATAAVRLGVDYIGVGPIFTTIPRKT